MADPPSSHSTIAATGTASSNVNGQGVALTAVSTVRSVGRWWLPLVFRFAETFSGGRRSMGRLGLIHSARWSLIREIPFNEPPQRRVRLNHPHLLFESTFNGGWEEYVDNVAHFVTLGIKLLWGTSYGFPQPLPTAPLKSYIRRNEIVASHFYSAYPEATTRMVLSALELTQKLRVFEERAREMTPEAFAAEWPRFLSEVQDCL
jgi:hypothetical protein